MSFILKILITFFLLLFSNLILCQENIYLDKILELENLLSKEKFLDTIIKIKYDKALTDPKKYLLLGNKAEKIAISLNDKNLIAKTYVVKSLAYHFTSKFGTSIDYTIKASNIFKKLNDYESLANSYLNLGWRIKNHNLTKGLYYMNKGLKILEKEKPNSLKLNGGYNNYGVLKQKKNQLDSALYYHNKSLKLCIAGKDSIGIPFAQTHIAEVYIKHKKYSKAKIYLNNALKLREKRNDYYGIADSHLYLGDMFFAEKKFNKAIYHFKIGEKLANKNSYYPLQKYATEYLYKSYENISDTKKSYLYYKTFTKLKDSILNLKTNSKISQLEVQFRTAEKEIEIAQQKEQLLEQQLSIKNRTLYALILGSALLLLGIISIGYYKRNQFIRKQLQKEIDLKDALATIKTQNRLQEQRLRISRDLHDNIGSQLTFIISSVDNLKYITKDANTKLKEKLVGISAFTSETIHQLRDTIWAMNKNKVTVEDLHARILSFIEKAKNATQSIDFSIDYNIDKNEAFSSLEGMNIFRVVQEAINNAIKYADASKIEIKIDKKENEFITTVIDNGVGFNINSVELGNGLSNMEKRMSEIGGEIKIISRKNNGTEIKLFLTNRN